MYISSGFYKTRANSGFLLTALLFHLNPSMPKAPSDTNSSRWGFDSQEHRGQYRHFLDRSYLYPFFYVRELLPSRGGRFNAIVYPFHVVPEIPVAQEAVPRHCAFAVGKMAKVTIVVVAMHPVVLSLMTHRLLYSTDAQLFNI